MDDAQCRMARAALQWTSRQLATAAGVRVGTVAKVEMKRPVAPDEVARLRLAFERAGVVFDLATGEGPGMRFKVAPGEPPAVGAKPVGPATDAVEKMDAEITEDRAKRNP